jgi:hypothetical protein
MPERPFRLPCCPHSRLSITQWGRLVAAEPVATPLLLGQLLLLSGIVAGVSLPTLAIAVTGLSVAMPIVAMIVRRPQRGLLLLAALAPYNSLLIIVPHPGIVAGWKEALLLGTLGLTVVTSPRARGELGRRRPDWWPAACALLVVGIASAAAVGGTQGLVGLKILCFAWLGALAVWRCPFNRSERDLLVTILMVNGFLTATWGLAQQALGNDFLHNLGYPYQSVIMFSGDFLRSFSTFNQPFGFAFFLMIVLLMSVPAALEDRRRLRNRLFLAALPIYSLGLLSAVVRGALLGLLGGVIYLGLTRHKRLLLLLPAAAVALAGVPANVASSLLSGSSGQARGSVWAAGLSSLVARPLGAGIGSTGAAQEKAAQVSGVVSGSNDLLQLDNYYFKLAYEVGVVGLWLFVLILLVAFLSAHDAQGRLAGEDAAFSAGVAAVVVASALACTVAGYLEIFPIDFYFWLMVGTVVSCFPRPSGYNQPQCTLTSAG